MAGFNHNDRGKPTVWTDAGGGCQRAKVESVIIMDDSLRKLLPDLVILIEIELSLRLTVFQPITNRVTTVLVTSIKQQNKKSGLRRILS